MKDDGRAPGMDDDELAAEIVLYGDLVVAASESDGDLTAREIDQLLGVDERDRRTLGARPPEPRVSAG